MSTHVGLILAGYSGVGKDTLFRELDKAYPGRFVNVKFSSLTKDILAQAFRVPRSWLDGQDSEPKWREENIKLLGQPTGVSALLLLQALFYGSPQTDLHRLNIEYALAQIPEGCIPVFTDIRRQEELDAVQKFNPYVVYLVNRELEPGKADGDVDKLFTGCDTYLYNTGFRISPEKMLGFLVEHLKKSTTLLKPRKPTLHLYVGCEPERKFGTIDNYEPFAHMLDQAQEKLAEVFSITGELAKYRALDLFQRLVSETSPQDLQLTPITKDCWMSFDKTHVSLLPKLREMANIQVHFKSGVPYTYGFTQQEIDNDKSV